MKVKLFEYTRRWEQEEFEKKVNDFMATVEVVDIKFSGTASDRPFDSVAILLVLYR